MKYICAQPAIPYYSWQLEVMIINFLEMGVQRDDIHILCTYNGVIISDFNNLKKYGVHIFFYEDTRTDRSYIPSVYFHALKKHLFAHPDLKDEILFLHDSDILFTRPVNFNFNMSSFHLSNTLSYINYDYVISKGEEQFIKMCEIVGISPDVVKKNNNNSGGAQYVVKGVTGEMFEKIERDSIKLYAFLCEQEPRWNKSFYPIQKWTAGMWAELWNFWIYGFETVIDKDIDFSWSTSLIEDIDKYPILHNAGVVDSKGGMFFKGEFISERPYFKNLDIDKSRCSFWYYNWVKRAEQITVLN